jgi:uncharacterized damage-inducible protein DinB
MTVVLVVAQELIRVYNELCDYAVRQDIDHAIVSRNEQLAEELAKSNEIDAENKASPLVPDSRTQRASPISSVTSHMTHHNLHHKGACPGTPRDSAPLR